MNRSSSKEILDLIYQLQDIDEQHKEQHVILIFDRTLEFANNYNNHNNHNNPLKLFETIAKKARDFLDDENLKRYPLLLEKCRQVIEHLSEITHVRIGE